MWKCNLFSLSHDLIRTPQLGIMRIDGWKLLAVCYHPDKFCEHRHWDSADINVLNL